MITIKNGLVFTQGKLEKTDILIEGEKIVKIAQNLPCEGKVIDAMGKVVSHGFIDLHVHLREPGFEHKETVKTGSQAAAAGGFTTICTMPNLKPVPDSVEHLKVQKDAIDKDGVIEILPFSSITIGEQGEEIVNMEQMHPLVCGFTDDGKGVQSREMMNEVMARGAKLGAFISAHCEDEELLERGYIHKGEYSVIHRHRGIPSACEYAQVARDIDLAAENKARYHVCHISARESLDLVRAAKARGESVSCEVTPHHIALSDMDIPGDEGAYKMNPPLRSREDRDAILNAIIDGTIDCIATDHAPHSQEEKAKGLEKSAMGIVGIETAFAVCYNYLIKENSLPIERLLELLTAGGKFINVENDIVEGAKADIVILDTDTQYEIDSKTFKSMGKSTPFEGAKVCGRVLTTIFRGQEVYNFE